MLLQTTDFSIGWAWKLNGWYRYVALLMNVYKLEGTATPFANCGCYCLFGLHIIVVVGATLELEM